MALVGKIIAVVGLALLLVGAVVWVIGKTGLRGLPGDVIYKSERSTFLFPIVTCIVLSIMASIIVWLVRSLGK